MPTNLWANWGSGKPVIDITTEIDALRAGSQAPGLIERKSIVPGALGYIDGHKTHGVATSAACAVRQIMKRDKLPGGTVVQFCGYADAQLISRPFLVHAGYFKDLDAAILLHIGDHAESPRHSDSSMLASLGSG